MNLDKYLPAQISSNSLILQAINKTHIPYNFYGHKLLKYVFKNIKLKKGIYCNLNNDILRETLDEHIAWTPTYIARTKIEDLPKEIESRIELLKMQCQLNCNKKIICKGNYIDLIHPFIGYAYGHLFDTLQKLYPLQNIINISDVKFLVKRYDNILDFCTHLSAICNRDISSKDLIVVDQSAEYEIENLYYGLSPVVPTTFCKETYSWIINRYYSWFSVDPNLEKSSLKYKIYCNRNHIKHGARGVLNNDEVISFLKENNFVVLTGAEPLGTIVEYFANAQIIIGAHGSLLANSMFCKPYSKIYEFCPDNRIDKSFYNKYKMCKNYEHIKCVGDVNYNITIPIETLQNIIL